MAHLQHLHRSDEAAAEQDLLDGRLGVAGEQRLERSVPEQDDHRAVVDVALRQRGAGIGLGRVEDLDARGVVKPDHLASSSERYRQCTRARGIGQELVVRLVVEVNARV
jgi:hypothetical protein